MTPKVTIVCTEMTQSFLVTSKASDIDDWNKEEETWE